MTGTTRGKQHDTNLKRNKSGDERQNDVDGEPGPDDFTPASHEFPLAVGFILKTIIQSSHRNITGTTLLIYTCAKRGTVVTW